MAYIEVKNLKYRYPHRKELALKGLNFSVERGEFIGILGQSKAGKSTLCQALVGLVPTVFGGAYGGSVTVDGWEAGKIPVAQMCRKVGLVFQNPFNQLSGARDTVFGEVSFGLQNLGIPREEIFARTQKCLQMMEVEAYRDRNPFDLSGGQIQRVALASILAMEPEVLVLDEPTSQLDPQGSEEVFRVVECLAKTGITIIMVEHKMEKLARYCDRLLLLNEGEQVAYDMPERIFSREDLENFGVEPPVYTKIAKLFDARSGERFPVTLEQMQRERQHFSETLTWKDEKAVKPFAPTFSVENLTFSYPGGEPVLSGFNLALDTRPTAIAGQNGAGKTTLVKTLKGLLKPSAGSISLKGEDIAKKSVAQLSRSVGYVFQNPDDQIFKSQVLEEVMVGPLNLGLGREKAKAQAREALAAVGLSGEEQTNPYDLDLSDRKMVAIASVLAMKPQVLILDEPTIAQDMAGKRKLGALVRRLADEGCAVLAILHDMDFAAEYFERVIVMAHGKVIADGAKAEVFYEREALEVARLEQPHGAKLARAFGYQGHFLTTKDFERAKENCE